MGITKWIQLFKGFSSVFHGVSDSQKLDELTSLHLRAQKEQHGHGPQYWQAILKRNEFEISLEHNETGEWK